MKKKICVAITGASGSLYASLLLKQLENLLPAANVSVIFSETGRKVWEYELSDESIESIPFKIYPANSYFAPMASGSSGFTDMVIIPCTMGTLGRIASGTSDDLIARAADVILKEKQRLILVTREAPYNLIHIRNMEQITLAGGIICPASPSFYSRPQNINGLAATIVHRVLGLMGFEHNGFRWGVMAEKE